MLNISLDNTRSIVASAITALQLDAVLKGDEGRHYLTEPDGTLSAARLATPDFRIEVHIVKAGADVIIRGGSVWQRARVVDCFNAAAPTGHAVHLDRGAVVGSPFTAGATYAYANFGFRTSGILYGEAESFAKSGDRAVLVVALYRHFHSLFLKTLLDTAIAGDPILIW